MITQDQLEVATQIARAAMKGSVYKPLTEEWMGELRSIGYKLARVAGLIWDESALEDFRQAIVDTVRRQEQTA